MTQLYKKHPSEYPEWEKYNPECGHVVYGRFVARILTCKNETCERYNLDISEKEAFYLYATSGFFKRGLPMLLRTNITSVYICPFCGSRTSLHPKNNDLTLIPFFRKHDEEEQDEHFYLL